MLCWLLLIPFSMFGQRQCVSKYSSSDTILLTLIYITVGSHFTPEVVGDMRKEEALRYLKAKFNYLS